MKYKVGLVITFLVFGLISGCAKKTDNAVNGNILGVKYSEIEQVKIFHDNITVLDLSTDTKVEIMDDLEEAIGNTGKYLNTLDGDLGIKTEEVESVAEYNSLNYYIQILFQNPQKISVTNNSQETHEECNSVLIDMDDLLVHWSKDGYYGAEMGYTNNTEKAKEDFEALKNNLVGLFADMVAESD